MGLGEGGESDRWQYDASNATWARFIVVPRTSFFHPSDGAAEEKVCPGPKLSDLRSYRWSIADSIPPIKDDWEKGTGEMEANGSFVEWSGRAFFWRTMGL